jgi:hypothetical protein
VRSKRTILVIALISVIGLTDLYVFGRYIPALMWHVRNGNHVEMNGIKFWVPLAYSEDHRDTMNQLSIDTFGGPFSHKTAFIAIDFHRQAPALPDSPEMTTHLERFGLRKSSGPKLTLAGREGDCFRYVAIGGGEGTQAAAKIMAGSIHCKFGDDLSVSFNGTQNAVSDFYLIVASAENVRGKH